MNLRTLLGVIVAAVLGGQTTRAHAATAFSDTFGMSTLNAATPAGPTTSSTNYAVLSSKNATGSSIAAGLLKVTNVPTSSGLTEVQARFSASPLALAAEGDFVELSTTFSPTGVMYAAGNGTFGAGLYNSHGVAPVPGGAMNNGLLNATDTTYASGFAAGWEGFHSRIFPAGNAQLITRPAQTDTVNESQDLLFANAASGAYDNPSGVSLAPTGLSSVLFTNGATYTYTLKIAMAAGGVLDVSHNIYEGGDVSGTNLFTNTAQTTLEQTIATQFDAFGMGFRAINDATVMVTEHTLNISRIEVNTNLAVAPPANANFNGDASVDGDDFLIWQRGLGLTGEMTIANGDADHSGTVDGADLTVWRNQFGLPPVAANAAAGVVPEPTCGSLAVVGGALLAAVRRRRG
jgi:hypothetical protein